VKCVILQPSYIPWRGFFHQIQKADVFVFYDDVQYDKGGWRNRNRIMTPAGAQWLTIPVQVEFGALINQVRTDRRKPWARHHRQTLHCHYRRAPYYREYAPLLDEIYRQEEEFLAEFTIRSTILLARALGLRTRFLRSSAMNIEGSRTGRLVSIAQALGADLYITGPSAKDYLETDLFTAAGIRVEFMTYDYPAYPQCGPEYDPNLSTIDLLMMTGRTAGDYIWGAPELEEDSFTTSQENKLTLEGLPVMAMSGSGREETGRE